MERWKPNILVLNSQELEDYELALRIKVVKASSCEQIADIQVMKDIAVYVVDKAFSVRLG